MPSTTLTPEQYFAVIDADTERLIELGERGLDPDVPSCPDWTVADVVQHVGMVYEHKVRVMADNAWPKPWPPAELQAKPPLELLREAKDDLFEEFSQHDVTEPTTTFGADTTIAFWVRRMALEVAVHRYDAELAHGEPTPVPADLALDGIDEILKVTLAGPWWTDYDTEHPVDARVAVESGGHRWLCDLSLRAVTVADDAGTPAQGTVGGEPEQVFLWLWGRAPDDAVVTSGDPQVVRGFRERLVECSG